MGNTACCGFEGEDRADFDVSREGEPGDRKEIHVSKEVFASWMKRFEGGDSMEVLFPDGHRIDCNLKIDRPKNYMNLSFNQKVRPIQLDDINAVLYGSYTKTPECSDSKMLQNPCVVGFRLGSSGRAIAFSFKTVSDAHCFISFLEEEIKKNEAGKPNTGANK